MEEVFILNNGPKHAGLRFFSNSRVTHNSIMNMFPHLKWTKKETHATRVVVPDGAEHVGERLIKRNKRLAHQMIPWSKFKTMYYQGDIQKVNAPIQYDPYAPRPPQQSSKHPITEWRDQNIPELFSAPKQERHKWPQPVSNVVQEEIKVPDIFAQVRDIPDGAMDAFINQPDEVKHVDKRHHGHIPLDNPGYFSFTNPVDEEELTANIDANLLQHITAIERLIKEWYNCAGDHNNMFTAAIFKNTHFYRGNTQEARVPKAGFYIRLYFRLVHHMTPIITAFKQLCNIKDVELMPDEHYNRSKFEKLIGDVYSKIHGKHINCTKDIQLITDFISWGVYLEKQGTQLREAMTHLQAYMTQANDLTKIHKQFLNLPLLDFFSVLFNRYCEYNANSTWKLPETHKDNKNFMAFLEASREYLISDYRMASDPYHINNAPHPCTAMEDIIIFMRSKKCDLLNNNLLTALKDKSLPIEKIKNLFSGNVVTMDETFNSLMTHCKQKCIFPTIVLTLTLYMIKVMKLTPDNQSLAAQIDDVINTVPKPDVSDDDDSLSGIPLM